ncbi:MAG TPA: hypothetical protein VFM18_18025 [Methanosarcina sp.]|nr:hypothetical protein [Methanosarcina sp.]
MIENDFNKKPTKTTDAFFRSFDPNNGFGFPVPDEWQQELYNYLVMGFDPGSFFTAVMANDLVGAAAKSHPANTWRAIQQLMKWILNKAPGVSWGSYDRVHDWLKLSAEERKEILERYKLLYTEKDIMWNILNK